MVLLAVITSFVTHTDRQPEPQLMNKKSGHFRHKAKLKPLLPGLLLMLKFWSKRCALNMGDCGIPCTMHWSLDVSDQPVADGHRTIGLGLKGGPPYRPPESSAGALCSRNKIHCVSGVFV